MGKSKFIDKRHAQTFSVVRRSQRDPLIADESSSPFVLVPVDNPKVRPVPSRADAAVAFWPALTTRGCASVLRSFPEPELGRRAAPRGAGPGGLL